MLLNYLKLAFRIMTRNSFFTLINVLGLAVGFACFFALWNYATSELKSNQYHKDYERIGRVGVYWRWQDKGSEKSDYVTFGFSKADLPARFKDDFPEVEGYTRILTQEFFLDNLVPHDKKINISITRDNGADHIFKETKVIYADSNLFDFFSIPLVLGQKDKVLSEADFVVLSQATARKYFGDRNPVGELIKLNDSLTLKVSGVYEDLPHYTHFAFDLVISNKNYLTNWQTAFLGATQNFIKLSAGSSFKDLENKINAKKQEYWSRVLTARTTVDVEMFIQPLHEIAFSNSFEGDEFPVRSRSLLIALASVSVVILIMAWANNVNLTLVRTTKRMKEFATRKINGAVFSDFIKQLIIESLLLHALSFLLAITFLQVMRQPFKSLLNIYIAELWSLDLQTWGIFFGAASFGILINVLIPVLSVSSRLPQSLYRMNTQPAGKKVMRSVLTVVQFSSAIVLILWGYVVYLELDFILNKEIGIDRKNIITIESPINQSKHDLNNFDRLVNHFSNSPGIEKVTYSRLVPGDNPRRAKLIRTPGSDNQVGLDANGVHETFIPFFQLQLLAGRNFIPDDREDVIIVSRHAATRLGFSTPESAIGARTEIQVGFTPPIQWKQAEIIGVIEDFRTRPFFDFSGTRSNYDNSQQSRGTLLTYKNRAFPEFLPEKIAFKLESGEFASTLAKIENEYAKIFPGNVFSWQFLDDNINQVYENEKITRNQIILFVILAIGISSLGLLGMISNTVAEKTKEIGIRKVLGARLQQIGTVLLKTTLVQILISIVVGLPIAHYLVQEYLQKFTERITVEWWHYAIPVLILLGILFTTIASTLFKAVRTNPVDSLRYE